MPRAPRERPEPDPFGRQVDLYPADHPVTVLIPYEPDDGWIGRARGVALAFADRVASDSIERVRNSQITVFVCAWQMPTGENLVALAVASDVRARVFEMLCEEVTSRSGNVWSDQGVLGDANGVPIVRYERGHTIVYVEQGVPTPELPPGVECRSFQIRRAGSTDRSTSIPLPVARLSPPTEHSWAIASDLQRDVLRFFYNIELPSTYAQLKRSVADQFGFVVRETPRNRIGHHGRITLDWLTDPHGHCTVIIEVARDLPAALRYVVLAHEIAHYAMHVPLLLATQAIEQMSWLAPGLDRWFAHEIATLLGDRSALEAAADELAGYAVLPRWYDRDFDFVLDVDRTPTSEQMKWAGLQSFFPHTRENDDFRLHRGRSSMLDREGSDLLEASGGRNGSHRGLYEVLLAAAVRRGSRETTERNQRVAEALARLEQLAQHVPASAAAFFRLDSNAQSAAGTELGAGRELYPPLSDAGADLVIRRWPVVPGQGRGRFRSVLQPDAAEVTLAEWRELVPRLAVVVYPDKHLPDRPVAGFFEDVAEAMTCPASKP